MASDGESLPLREVKRHDCLGLLREAMVKLGPTSQTLAAVRRMARGDGETFACAAKIADMACRSQRSCERDLETLVRHGWLKRRGRENRRTPTYIVDADLMNGTDVRRFAILPRWAARMLTTWSECAVFAAIVSRDSLNEHIGDGEAGENFGRLQYPAKLLAKDTGLSVRAIGIAKASLLETGVIQIDPAMLYQESDGRLRTIPDTLMLNPDFEVPAHFIDRSAKVADPSPFEAPYRGANLAGGGRKSGGDLAQKWRSGGRKSGGCSYSQLSTSTLTSTSTSTAEPPSASPLVCEEEEELVEKLDRFVVHCRNAFGASCPLKIADAIFSAIDNGCDFPHVYKRVEWAFNNRLRWKHEHRAGALFVGISEATPDLKPEQGWPYLT